MNNRCIDCPQYEKKGTKGYCNYHKKVMRYVDFYTANSPGECPYFGTSPEQMKKDRDNSEMCKVCCQTETCTKKYPECNLFTSKFNTLMEIKSRGVQEPKSATPIPDPVPAEVITGSPPCQNPIKNAAPPPPPKPPKPKDKQVGLF